MLESAGMGEAESDEELAAEFASEEFEAGAGEEKICENNQIYVADIWPKRFHCGLAGGARAALDFVRVAPVDNADNFYHRQAFLEAIGKKLAAVSTVKNHYL